MTVCKDDESLYAVLIIVVLWNGEKRKEGGLRCWHGWCIYQIVMPDSECSALMTGRVLPHNQPVICQAPLTFQPFHGWFSGR